MRVLESLCLFGSDAIDSGPFAFSADRFANNSASDTSLDMAPISRFSRWAVLDGDIVILARAANHCASELFRIVAVDFAHFSPAAGVPTGHVMQ
jgi:hypothetical protein